MAEVWRAGECCVVVRVSGTVQGVGFRPFVYNLARELGLRGRVWNSSQGVVIELEGPGEAIDKLVEGLRTRAPVLARIEDISTERIRPRGYREFTIVASRSEEGVTLIPPDVAACRECLEDVLDRENRRFRYPFTNCTNCGPRFTIVLCTPYDREKTTMASFQMCRECREEYEDPINRRFHAQPNACPVCGPHLTLLDASGREVVVEDALGAAVSLILDGRLLAIKGLGGFHLACDALNRDAIVLLRRRKRRSHKPLAVMVPDLAWAERLCLVGPEERQLLQSPASPIVLLRRRPDSLAPEEVAPGNRYLGVFLPYTPLHHLLLRGANRPLVMTSGNLTDEPICRESEEALQRLAGIADYFLVHNRGIRSRCDDSVMLVVDGTPLSLRRSRGFVPRPVHLSMKLEAQVLGCGGDLKNSFCLGKDAWAVPSQYIGDLQGYLNARFWKEALEHMSQLLSFRPEIVAHDMHPGYLSTRLALGLECEVTVAVQHHHAHVVSVMAEMGLEEAVGVALDGTGYGPDGTVWGGEFLLSRYDDFERMAHLEQVPMPGGEMAIRQPWRMALSHLHAAFGDAMEELDLPFMKGLDQAKVYRVLQVLRKGVRSPTTSSMGRLFDAVSSLLGLRQEVTYEGQAAVELQMVSEQKVSDSYPVVVADGGRPWRVLTGPIVRSVVEDLLAGVARRTIAGRFHNAVVGIIDAVAARIAQETGVRQAVLSGGVFQNAIISSGARRRLEARGLKVYLPKEMPPNDQGIALGQVLVAAAKEGVTRCV